MFPNTEVFVNFRSTSNTPSLLPKTITFNEDNEINVLAYFKTYSQSSTRSATEDLGLSYPSI